MVNSCHALCTQPPHTSQTHSVNREKKQPSIWPSFLLQMDTFNEFEGTQWNHAELFSPVTSNEKFNTSLGLYVCITLVNIPLDGNWCCKAICLHLCQAVVGCVCCSNINCKMVDTHVLKKIAGMYGCHVL